MILDSLGLQRNTSKTMTFRIPDLPREKLQRMLRDSLSTVAQERHDSVEESKRQDKLRTILQESFDPHTASDFAEDDSADFRKVAFVLNRIKHKEETIKDIAYHVLDHDLEHSYQALKYLTLHAPDDKLKEKLKFILAAEYEPRSLKALALYCLQKLLDPHVEVAVNSIVYSMDKDDWHLIRSILKQVIRPALESFSPTLLDSIAASENSHVEVYARWLMFEQVADQQLRIELTQAILANNSHHIQKLGIYLAHRYGLLDSVDVTWLESDLRSLFPEPILNDIENFRKEFSAVFGILLDRDFPIGKYFGRISCVRNACVICMHHIKAMQQNL